MTLGMKHGIIINLNELNEVEMDAVIDNAIRHYKGLYLRFKKRAEGDHICALYRHCGEIKEEINARKRGGCWIL